MVRMDRHAVTVLVVIAAVSIVNVNGAVVRGRLSEDGSNPDSLPSRLSVTVDMGGSSLDLNLDRTSDLQPHLPVYSITRDLRGLFHIHTTRSQTAFNMYQDVGNGAAFILVPHTDDHGKITHTLEGMVQYAGKVYQLKTEVSLGVPQNRQFPGYLDLQFDVEDVNFNATEYLNDYDVPSSDEEPPVSVPYTGLYSQPRQANQDVYVDIVAFADFGVYSAWYGRSTQTNTAAKRQEAIDKIKQYYALVFNEIDLMYKSPTTLSFTIFINLVGIVIAETAQDSPWTEDLRITVTGEAIDEVNGYQALDDIRSWVKTADNLPNHDHFMFFSGYDLTKPTSTGQSDTLLGRTAIGGTCRTDGQQTSVVEDFGNLRCAFTGAHELGHSLYAAHDGSNNDCLDADRFIMSTGGIRANDANKLNAWIFSTCSADYFRDFVTTKVATSQGEKCLYDSISADDIPDVTSVMPGQLYDANEQCRRVYGPQSTMEPCASIMNGTADVCTNLRCYVLGPDGGLCYRQTAARGTTCGIDKWCFSGECISRSQTNECASNPCQNGGSCSDGLGFFTCACLSGFLGDRCERNNNDCDPNPCLNGGTCTDNVNGFTCLCPPGFSGQRCEADNMNECSSNPCANGGFCNDNSGFYTCTCVPGFTGTSCETILNVCFNNPCVNGATCQESANGFVCNCLSGFSGSLCENFGVTDLCASNPCQNAGSCVNYVAFLVCNCAAGFSGTRCEIDDNECASNPCQNSGTCTDGVNGYICTCRDGYSGSYCENCINMCASYPCENGGICDEGDSGYTCTCRNGFYGPRCENVQCHYNPCVNGATCDYSGGSYNCICPSGFSGTYCETDVDECYSNPCQNGGTCTEGVGTYTCTCRPGYKGTNCENAVVQCPFNPCANGGTCDYTNYSYNCDCAPGFYGTYCENGDSACASTPCQNGAACYNSAGGYTCQCRSGYTGSRCETKAVVQCPFNPCANGSTCDYSNNQYNCICSPGYSGTYCQTAVSACASAPCQNTGTCADSGDGYTCSCRTGFSGPRCENVVMPCSYNPCTNGGTCTFVGDVYTCSCPPGFSGTYCELSSIPTNACASTPCENGGICNNFDTYYTCFCLSGFSGDRCQLDNSPAPMCAFNPCANGGTCALRNGVYTCTCASGYSGTFCRTAGDVCANNPCLNGGTCNSTNDGYTCTCPVSFSGRRCEVITDHCASRPCYNGATCKDLGTYYTCFCANGFYGYRCETTTSPGEGSLRLVGGSHRREGRVEVLFNGHWGTVCSNGWTPEDAAVVCRQLGFVGTTITAYTDLRYGPGSFSSRVWLSNVSCDGSEFRLMDCPANPIGSNSCGHGQDAGLSCGVF
ncbi:fibropellin-1-like isoform X2 [Littorina saxatilis]|uniref:fibropellin-1-like isoform X2 n=1 Tax=Littorina saxatilis TaxID=31220 RepID=UPI0038B4AC44